MRITPEYSEGGEPMLPKVEADDPMEKVRRENRAVAEARRREVAGRAALLNAAQLENMTAHVQADSSPYFAD